MKQYLRSAAAAAVAVIVISGLMLSAPSSVAADWKPDKPIEFIVGTGPGSGVDNTTGKVLAILQTQKLVEPQINVVNKPGGPYAIAFSYLAQFQGDGTRLVLQTSTPLTALVTGQFALKYFEFNDELDDGVGGVFLQVAVTAAGVALDELVDVSAGDRRLDGQQVGHPGLGGLVEADLTLAVGDRRADLLR